MRLKRLLQEFGRIHRCMSVPRMYTLSPTTYHRLQLITEKHGALPSGPFRSHLKRCSRKTVWIEAINEILLLNLSVLVHIK